MSVMRPEHEILINIACRELRPENVESLRRLARHDIDWEYLLDTARQHGVIPLLQKHTNKAIGDLLPGSVRTKLKQESVANAQSVLYLTSIVLQVAKLFGENGIPTAFFKGPILSEQVYGELALRQAGDIDILIPRPCFNRAKGLLGSLGFQMYPQLTTAQETSHLGFHCEIQFVRDDWFTVVDLHWGLTPRSFVFGLTGDEVMSRLQKVPFAGSQIQTFSSEDLLLYQAMHGAKHLWRKLEWISSLSALVQTLESSKWTSLVELAVKARATRILALGLRLTENLFRVTAPSDVLATIDEDNSMKELAEKICRELFVPRVGLPDSTDSNLNNLRIMDRKRDALSSLMRAIFVPTLSDWQAVSIPSALHPLYYGFRPLRLTTTYGMGLWRKLLHRST